MTPPQKPTSISSDFTGLILGIPPKSLSPAPVSLPGVDIPKPSGESKDFYSAALNNSTVKSYVDGAQSGPVAYLENWKKNWWEGKDADRLRNDPVARDDFLSTVFVLYHQSKNPAEKTQLLNIFLQGAKDSLETLKALKKDNNIHYMADGFRRLNLVSGAMLGELKADTASGETQTQILILLRDASQEVSSGIPTENAQYRHVRLYAEARALLLNLALTPPDAAQSRKKLNELTDLLQKAKEAAQAVEAPYLKEEFIPLIDADLNFLPKRGSDILSARELVARQTANFVMLAASEIDLTEGDSIETVQKRYKALTQALEEVIAKNPTGTFKETLEKVSTPEAVHLKSLIGKSGVLQDLRQTEELALLQGTEKLKGADYVAKWSSAVLAVVEHRTEFKLGGNEQLTSFREILNQFIKSQGGTAPSPISQAFQEFTGTAPSQEAEISARATKRFLEMDSTGFKISNGVGRFLSMENLLFIGAAGAMNRVGSSLLIRRAGASGTLGALVKEGQLTGWGHFAVGGGVGGVLSFGFAGHQYMKDVSADRPEAGGNFLRNFLTGLVINTAALGLSFAGSSILRNRMLAKEAQLLQAGGPLPSSARLFFNRSVAPYTANLAIGTGGMLATNALFRLYHNVSHPDQKAPLVTLDEVVETTLTMAALPLAERPMHRIMMRKQLGEYRLTKINTVADRMMTQHYGDRGSPSPYGPDRNLQPHVWDHVRSGLIDQLGLRALRGMEIKHLENPAFQAKIAESLKLPKQPALPSGAPITGSPGGTVISPVGALPAAAALPAGRYPADNGKAVEFTPMDQIPLGPAAPSPNAKVESINPHPSDPRLVEVSVRHHDGHARDGIVVKVSVPADEQPGKFPLNARGHLKEHDLPAAPAPVVVPVITPAPVGPPTTLFTTLDGAQIQLGRKMTGGMNPAGGPPLAPTRNAGSLYGRVLNVEYDPQPAGGGDLKVTLQLEQLGETGLPQHILRLDPQTARTMDVVRDTLFPILNYQAPPGGEALPRVAPVPVAAPLARPVTASAAGVFSRVGAGGEEYYLKRRPDNEGVIPGFVYGKVTEILPAPQAQDPNSPATVTLTKTNPATGQLETETFIFKIPQNASVNIGVEQNALFAMRRYFVDDITPPRGTPILVRPGEVWPTGQGIFLGVGDNLPGAPRQHKVKIILPGFGEAAGFTQEGIDKKMWDDYGRLVPNYSPVNEDGFGIDPHKGVIVVADGMGGQGNGDKASHHGVKAILDFMQGPGANLGDAFLAGHQAIRTNCGSGACVAAGVQIMPDGTVKTALAGDARLWVLRPQPDGTFEVIEPYLPDTFATVERLFPAANPLERMQRKQMYEQAMGYPLDDRDVSIDNTLSMNASQLNSRVRSGLGYLGGVQPRLVSEMNYQFGNLGQILHTTVMVPDPMSTNGGKVPLKLAPGDVLLLMSDGVADLFNRAQMAKTVAGKTDVESMARAVELATLANLHYFQNLAQGAPSGQRVIMLDGRFIDARGDIFASGDLNDTQLIGHVGPDNITATLFRYNPSAVAVEPAPSRSTAPGNPPGANPPAGAASPKNLFDDPTGQYRANDLDPAKLFDDAERIEPSKVVPNPALAGDPSITVVNRNYYQQASELFQRIKAQLETDSNLSLADQYVVLKLEPDANGNLIRRGIDFHQSAPTCAADQAVLEIKTDASGARQIILGDTNLPKLLPQALQALTDTFAVQLTNAHVLKKAVGDGNGNATEGSGARTIPPGPGANDTTQQHQRVDLQIVSAVQNRLQGYLTQLAQGKISRGKLIITTGSADKQLHYSWQPDDGVTQKVGEIPPMTRHVLTVEITGDVRNDPNAYQVQVSRELKKDSPLGPFVQKTLEDLGFKPKK